MPAAYKLLYLHPSPPHLPGNLLFTCFRCVKAVKQLTNADPQRGNTSPVMFNAQQRFRKTFFAVGQDLDALKAAAERRPRWLLDRWGPDKLKTAFAEMDNITNQPGG